MTLSGEPVWDAAIRGIRVRCGTQTNCGGIAAAVIDAVPDSDFRLVRQLEPNASGEPAENDVDACARHFEDGVRAALVDVCGGALPALRIVLRRILVHPTDS